MTIEGYLAELERELRRRRAPTARLLREAEDHLRELADELAANGLAGEPSEPQAVKQFGAAAAVAARFAEATASTTAHGAVTLAAAAFVAYTSVFLAFATGASPLLRDLPQGVASFFALQLAAVAVLVAFVRSLRWRGMPAAPSAELKAIARALSIGCAALAGAAVGEGAVAVSRPAGVIAWSEGRWLTLAFAAAVGVVLSSTIAAVRASAQAQAVAALPSRPGSRDVALLADGLDALVEQIGLSQVGRALRALLAHPWRAAVGLAVVAFVAVSAASLADSGGSGLAGALALGALEASLILVGFLTFGRRLGLRDPAKS